MRAVFFLVGCRSGMDASSAEQKPVEVRVILPPYVKETGSRLFPVGISSPMEKQL